MGCGQSKIENEEAVIRCRDRKQYMKSTVSSRNAFAAAHSAYVVALRHTGSAWSDYGQSEMGPPSLHHHNSVSDPSASSSTVAASATVMPQQPMDNLPPPPPPLPNFSPSPLMRSTSMPDLPTPKITRRKTMEDSTITEEDEDAIEEEEERDRNQHGGDGGGGGGEGTSTSFPSPPPPLPPREQSTPPPPPPPPQMGGTWDYFFEDTDHHQTYIQEKEERVKEDNHFHQPMSPSSASGSDAHAGGVGGDDITPPVTPAKVEIDATPSPPVPVPSKPVKKSKQGEGGGSVHHQHASSAGASETKRVKIMSGSSSSPPVNLVQMLTDIDDHFLKASESAISVSRMLEATRLHYHSNFADNRGHIDHSARVMKVITWNRSFKGLSNNDDGKDDFDNEESETHATVLDKLLAWEKKLYDEVKAGEHMKIKYQKKVTELNRQKKPGTNPNKLEKTKAEVSHLHTRYIVDMQSMDSTVSEIQRLRDHQLYPKLDALVNGMAGMWETMHTHHANQLKIVMELRSLDISSTPKMTSPQHYNMTEQLFKMATEWNLEFEKLITHQKEYIQHLNNWLKSNLIPIESTLKEKVSSPLRVHTPPIQHLVHAWNEQLGNLPNDIAKHAISSFAAVMDAILTQQREEMKQKDKCEAMRKEYNKKFRIHADWKEKTRSLMTPTVEGDQGGTENANLKAEMEGRESELEGIKIKMIEEEEAYLKQCKQVREKAVGSLKMHLPELFRAIAEFSHACSEMYKYLRSISQMHK